MNQAMPERRERKRTKAVNTIELIAGDTRIPARLLNISFVGLQGRLPAESLAGLEDQVTEVILEDLPAVAITVEWTRDDTFGARFAAPEKAGRIIAGLLEIYPPPPA